MGARWFLVAESRWEDKLKILEWDDLLASQRGMHQACSVAHVQELVVHWMTTGSVDYPFAQIRPQASRLRFWKRSPEPKTFEPTNLDSETPIGELAVDRQSLHRVLSESPHSLKSILDALMAALQRESPADKPRENLPEEQLEIVARQI
jgi:hypothetical protein